MAKLSSLEKNKHRMRLVKRFKARRAKLKDIACDMDRTAEDRFSARLKLSKLPRNSSATRVRNRCELTGRPRGYYGKFRICRIKLRELSAVGQIPGMVKASW
jgi:small subunit ribosomal protein S14